MATNEILQFASTDTGTNLLTQAEYTADAQRTTGNQPGIARSKLVNKSLRQSSLLAATLAQYMANRQAENVVDTKSVAQLEEMLRLAIQYQIDISLPLPVPTGGVIYVPQSVAPDGYLKANGATVSRAAYASLFGAIGTTFGAGDGSTTFKLPDLRGEFLRGLDDGRGVDSGRTLGSAQLDALQRMTGDVGAVPATSSNHSYAGVFFPTAYGFNEYASTSGRNYYHGIGFDSSLVARSADETRPRNLAFLACIKY